MNRIEQTTLDFDSPLETTLTTRTRSVPTQPWLDHKADQRQTVTKSRWRQASGQLIRSDVELLSTDCAVKKQPHECSRGPQCSMCMYVTFIAGARPGASGSQTLAANSDVELDQPVCKQ